MIRTCRIGIPVVLLCFPVVVFAQGGQYGSIVGSVFDQSGAPIKGIKISATSETQIGGKKTTYTNEEGNFRFPLLEPGVFEVQASAPKMQTQVQKNVKVGITAPAELNFIMEVQSVIEEVKVVQARPMVSTTTAQQKEEFDIEFVEALPLADVDVIFQQVSAEVGGAISGSIRGGFANSVNSTSNTADGFESKGMAFFPAGVAAYEVSTAGFGSENAMGAGGLINIVSKTGSNKFEANVRATMDSSRLRFFTDATDSVAPSYTYVFSPNVSGPIIKDRLWYMVGSEIFLYQFGRAKDPRGFLPDPNPNGKLESRGMGKLTWQISSRHKLSVLSAFDVTHEWNSNGLGYTLDSQQDRRSRRMFGGFIFESLLADNLLFRTQAGLTLMPEDIYPKLCDSQPDTCDVIPPVRQTFPVVQVLDNNTQRQQNNVTQFQFRNRFQWFIDSKTWGDHSLTLHDWFLTTDTERKLSHPGDQILDLNGTTPQQLTTYYSNDPRLEDARYGWRINTWNTKRHLTTLSDAVRLTRYLTLSGSVSHIWASASNAVTGDVISQSKVVPSLSLAWDATHDGRTVVRSSYSEYVDVNDDAIAQHTLGAETSQTCQWNPTGGPDGTGAFNQNCTWQGGAGRNTIGLPCGPNGVNPDGTSCRVAIKVPKTFEYTFGVEREIVQGIAVEADLTYRKFLYLYTRPETNRIWNASGTAFDQTSSFRDGTSQTILDLESPNEAQRRWAGVTFGVKKRAGRLKLHVFYTLSMEDGNIPEGGSNLDGTYGAISPQNQFLWGYMPNDHRHELKITSLYSATQWLSFGLRYNYFSGGPYSHLYRNDVTNGFSDYRSPRGTNPGANINDPGTVRELRLPDRQSVNVQVRVNWLPLIGHRIETYVDVLNVLALRTQTNVVQTDGPAFGTPGGSRMNAFQVRLGLNYRY